jgi:serine/threonine-protein kinase
MDRGKGLAGARIEVMMTTPDRWRVIKPLLEAAIALPPAEREAFLEAECGEPEIRGEIRAMLASYEASPDLGEIPAAAMLASEEPTTQRIASRIDQYEIVRAIGVGGMGEVYLAIDTRLGRKVALKVLPQELTDDPVRIGRLMQEARTASALNHPNIVTVHELGVSGELHFITEEFVEGETLRERLRSGPISPDEAIGIALQVASALEAAHAAGVVHRDIKPENIMIRRDGLVKVLDFGLAKFVVEAPGGAAQMHTSAGMILGTMHYMSPEQARGIDVDARSDLWSLGVVIYEMLAQRRPFDGPTASDVIVRILQAEAPSMDGIPQAELQRILRKCFAKDKEHRYRSASELASDLREVRSSLASADASSTKQRRTWLDASKLSTRSSRALLAVALALLVATVSISMMVQRSREPDHAAVAAAPRAPSPVSIALLPLADALGRADEAYFADGVTWELQRQLEAVDALRVTGQGSVSLYKDGKKPAAEIARELGVSSLLSGTVQHDGDRVRIEAKVTDGRSGRSLWAESFDTTLADLLETEIAIARAVNGAVGHGGEASERRQPAGQAHVKAEAHEALLKAMGAATNEEYQRGLEKAVELDPQFALGWSMLADQQLSDAWFGQTDSPMIGYPKGKELALRALSIDESDSSAHTSIATVKLHHEWDWAGAEREIRRAIELSPSDAAAHHIYAHYLLAMDRTRESVRESRIASELDPLNTGLQTCVIWHCLYARQYDDAVAECLRLVNDKQAGAITYFYLGRIYLRQGKIEEGIAALEIAEKKAGKLNDVLATLGYAYGVGGRRADALRVLEALKTRSKDRYVSAFDIAVVYAGLGDTENTFEWLDRSFLERSTWFVHLKWDDRFAAFRSDPRMASLLRRMGLPNPGSVKEPEKAVPERYVTQVALAR